MSAPSTPPVGSLTPASPSTNAADRAHLPTKRRTGPILVVVIVVVIVAVLLGYGATAGGWFNHSNSGAACAADSQGLTGAGSTFVYPLMNTWTTQYAQVCNVDVNYQAIGSSSGITSLEDKAVDFGASDAPLSPLQRAALPGPTLTIPETAGGVVLLYNLPGFIPILNLSGPVIAAIYLGDITNWSAPQIAALNPGVVIPAMPIITVHRLDGSGTSFAFTSYLSQENATWSAQYGRGLTVNWPVGEGAKGSTGVAGTVGITPGAIGYDELAYADLNHLTFATVENDAGSFILANQSNVQEAVSEGASGLPAGTGDWYNVSLLNQPGSGTYPIVTFSYLMVYADLTTVYGSSMTQSEANALGHFIYWVLAAGQSFSPGVFYIPLPANVVQADQTTLGLLTFNGAPVSTH
ncbi:MAG: phosphate ABC transporter substrate-binding protein PstS [Thermoplasmata archaeon]|nr:phosphate ABC transporter substrate-binding protein PstS [Thermoplasmata archaeon]